MDTFRFDIVDELEELSGKRIDKAVSVLVDSVSRSYVQKLIRENTLYVNETPVKASYRLRYEDRVSFALPPREEPDILPEDIPLSILYEDDDILVVDKPKGMVVHPAAGHYGGTLVNAVMFHCGSSLSGINGVLRPGIVHRIDRDTTGALVICKNDAAHRRVAEQIRVHSITRRYRAICHGVISRERGTIHTDIGRHPVERKKMAVVPTGSGRDAVTHYRVLQRFAKHTYVECELETGRTHQIRVHLSHIGHPLLGDAVYGHPDKAWRLEGQTLHAYTLGLVHPTSGEYMEFTAPLPDYFKSILCRL